MIALALALAPTLAIVLFILYRDKFDREPATVLFGSFLYGVLATMPAMALEIGAGYFGLEETVQGTVLYVFFGVALVEEFVKFVPLRYYAFNRRSFDEPLDGIVHGVMVGLGFATLENLLYVYEHGISVAIARMFLSVPGHAAYGVIMGYFFGKSKFDYRNRFGLLLTGLVTATFFHGLYDSCLFVSQKVDDGTTKALLIVGALTTDIVAYIFAARLIKQHRRISRFLYVEKPVCTIRTATTDDIPLIRTLANQVWPLTYESILSRSQIIYMMRLIYSEEAIRRQMASGHSYLIVYNAGIPVGFASYSLVEPPVCKLQKIYVLPNQQGRGTGRFLVDQVIALAIEGGATILRLNVNRHNKARSFYERLGFAVCSEEKIDIGSGYVMDDFVMEKSIHVTIENSQDHTTGETVRLS
ncbi:GNAT family N-acetyltransferase [Flavisolibacter nicotianae]|uniref:GNAT family N-acetyltransferase n=1 Tax=Flavisolibacter nicotianae TaxID=2364882 RepID=UPI000EB267C9|nr:GNAT family N-acetyltransferase [Flavisolibacter nicotianae]